MQPEERDAAYLWDMLQAARDAAGVVAGLSLKQLQQDRVRMLALERSMELIGEAARRVSRTFCAKHPEIPWKEIVGLRNILAHEYGRVDHAQLHTTAIEDLPELIASLNKLLPSDQ